MAKILLVEDDNNLREIYEARLQAEGYTIVAAHDGEEALVVAKAEKPDLIISDVMMPKISGFEMLDILRNTDTLKDVKIIMLTALGQSDDQQRADKLGADRYLVKSQVTLEDIVNVTNDLLKGDGQTVDAVMPSLTEKQSSAPTQTASTTLNEPVALAPEPVLPAPEQLSQMPPPPLDPSLSNENLTSDINLAETSTQESGQVQSQIADLIGNQAGAQAPPTTPPPTPAPTTPPTSAPAPIFSSPAPAVTNNSPTVAQNTPAGPPPADDTDKPLQSPSDNEPSESTPTNYAPLSAGMRVIQPLPETETPKPDLSSLLQQEEAKESAEQAIAPPPAGATVIAPAAPAESGNVDPNNIAL